MSAKLLYLLLSIVVLGLSYGAGQDEELLIKMALVYKISKFVEWPKPRSDTEPFTICAVGAPDRIGVFNNLAHRHVGKHPIALDLHSKFPDSVDHCRILYIDASLGKSCRCDRAESEHVLTISDAEAFSTQGGIIELAKKNQRIHIIINLKNSKKHGLMILAPLLQVSTVISD
ncbi:MAG: YfiR family protein [Gammaproteobacteria bacterium]